MEDSTDKATALAETRTDLALQRTIIASERTLMAWIRTSISMIGFGFTVYKFFQYLREDKALGVSVRVHSPRVFGLVFITLGTLALIAAIWEHREFIKRIGVADTKTLWSLAVLIAILLAVIGAIAFTSVLLRTGPF